MRTPPSLKVAAARPLFPDQDLAAIQADIGQILRSGRLILGDFTSRFEEEFRSYTRTQHAVAVSTCTAALQIALRFHRSARREVIVPTNNFAGVVSAILSEGGIPVLADMDPQTFCVDTADLLSRITPRTAGVIVVHIAGLIYPDIDELRGVCEARGLFLIEDASHAHGAALCGRRAGSLAETACFSFYPTKIMTTGTGGMITTRNEDLARYARSVRHHGLSDGGDRVVDLGNDWCLGEINAVLGRCQLRHLDEFVAHRNHLVTLYREQLAAADWLTIPKYPPEQLHAYYKFPVLLDARYDRDRFRQRLRDEFLIENGAVYDPPCHLQPALQGVLHCREGMFPRAETTLRRQLCLPIHSGLTEGEVRAVVEALYAVANE